jgi:hypothetical protein
MGVAVAASGCGVQDAGGGGVEMDGRIPVTYRDRRGEVATFIRNDGKTLSMIVRRVEFSGPDFDSLSPARNADPSDLATFTLAKGDLCSCLFEAEMTVPVVVRERPDKATLRVRLELGDPRPDGGIDRETLSLVLCVGDEGVESGGTSGWFEGELLDIQRQLSPDAFIKACINCAFSDYSPYGHGLFGSLACFRDNKAAYLSVKSKDDLFRIWDSMTEFVQETYLCPEFTRRVPGAGYRG